MNLNRAFAAIAIALATAGSAAATSLVPRWVETGHLNYGRAEHTASLLTDGTVLVAGGMVILAGTLGSAELYDPATGRWRATGPMTSARFFSTATRLQDGRVLVAAGYAGQSAPRSAELYDPATGMWSRTGNLATEHLGHTATLLPNGKVLVVGGTSDFALANNAELYDPASGQWSAAAQPAYARSGHTATLLQNGTVLVAGGISAPYDPDIEFPSAQKAEIYDPASNTWRQVGTPIRADSHGAVLLANGKVLIAGGNMGVACIPPSGMCHGVSGRAAQLFDPVTESWAFTGSLSVSHNRPAIVVLADGRALVTGGGTVADVYDPGTALWTPANALNVSRDGHTATLLTNGNVLVAGGVGTAGNTAELFGVGAFPPVTIGAEYTGAWYDPAQSGHGIFIEVLPDNRLLAAWFTFNPSGTQQAWFTGVGTYSGDTASIASVDMPTGGRWIPNFNPGQVVHNPWGTLTIRFSDCDHGTVDFNSIAGYGAGRMNVTRLTQPLGLACP